MAEVLAHSFKRNTPTMPDTIKSYIKGHWIAGDGEGIPAYHAITGDLIGHSSSEGLDYEGMLQYARKTANPVLRRMTFRERGLMLKKLALFLHARKDSYYPVSYMTGATKVDSWIDIEGGIGNIFANASLRRRMGDHPYYIDGDGIPLSKEGSFSAQHIMVPKTGVAVHINAYNFPIWGMLEKIAVNLLAGVPAVVKPSPLSGYLTEVMVRDIIDSGILPEGSLQLVSGSGHGILEHVTSQDIVTFTGSALTGKKLRAHPRIIEYSVPFTMEADSLNGAILAQDAVPGTPEFDLFIKEVRKEMTVKCGQKCTAIRRIIVPESLLEDVQIALAKSLSQTTIGDPAVKGVRMGALVSRGQRDALRDQIQKLQQSSEIIYGSLDSVDVTGADAEKGAFFSPILLRQDNPLQHRDVHDIEAFGPVSTIMPYADLDEAIHLSQMGRGSLVSSIVTYDDQIARQYVLGAASHHGRILILNRDCAAESTGHGSPLPQLTHGGPGRAGGGEEMGGIRGVKHYLQRCAVQGSPTSLTAVTQRYQIGGRPIDPGIHPFRKHFEELEVGETLMTHKRTITEADIINFANVSWDHFYAHTDETSLDGTIFEQRVAHGYFVLSAAAGLFVHPAKGPVLLNYGLEDCRFTKPVYAGMTIGVRFTVKEKMDQEKREDEPAKGIVKFLVDVYDEEDETVAIATILTMVKKLDQGESTESTSVYK